jgi:hypothetical protein
MEAQEPQRDDARFVLWSSPLARWIMVILMSPMWLGGLWQIVHWHDAGGLILIGIAFGLWAYGIGVCRIIATDTFVEQRRFWGEWRLPVQDTTFRFGTGGDIPILPSVILENRKSGLRGDINIRSFAPARLRELLSFLEAHGATEKSKSTH